MPNRWILSLLALATGLPPAGCASSRLLERPRGTLVAANNATGRASDASRATPPPSAANRLQQPRHGARAKAPPNSQRYVIYRARLTLAVFKRSEALSRARAVAKRLGGYMTVLTERSITLRVPSSRLDAALSALGKLGELLRRDIRGQDVTEQYLDLEIRLKNARAVRVRLLALLAKAKGVKDSVLIERELARVTEQIERLEGRLDYLKKNVAYSTVTVELAHKRSARARALRRRLPFRWVREVGVDSLLRAY
ncbi:MAG: DUF4349 domain-containing protein [Myxococcales bacterium]|nr:DUF4349 domain-containing protein [Myxococcales bacterium]